MLLQPTCGLVVVLASAAVVMLGDQLTLMDYKKQFIDRK
jgi:hypothetical protein